MKKYQIVLVTLLFFIAILFIFKNEVLIIFGFFTEKSHLYNNDDNVFLFISTFYIYLITFFVIIVRMDLFTPDNNNLKFIDEYQNKSTFNSRK